VFTWYKKCGLPDNKRGNGHHGNLGVVQSDDIAKYAPCKVYNSLLTKKFPLRQIGAKDGTLGTLF